jgi:cytochrome c-type biogenesis protein CcmH/NrfG
MRHGQFALALRSLQQAVEWNPGHFLPWLELGLCQETLGLAGTAEKSLSRARELNPHNRAAAEGLARLGARSAGDHLRGWWRRLRK